MSTHDTPTLQRTIRLLTELSHNGAARAAHDDVVEREARALASHLDAALTRIDAHTTRFERRSARVQSRQLQ